MKKYLLAGFLCFISFSAFAQVDRSSELFQTLQKNDSLLFVAGYNGHDIRPFEELVSDNFEFYHDQGGITDSKESFVDGIRNGLFKLDYIARRELDESSLCVYPLLKNGVIYGAIQCGVHSFYAKETNKPEYFTSKAKFTHVWLIEEGKWKLSRGLSYDHQQ